MRRAAILAVVVFGAGVANAEVVRVEFAARASPAAKCPPQAEPELAEAVLPPGSELSGAFTYDTDAPHLDPNKVVFVGYDFDPDRFDLVLSVGPAKTFSGQSEQRYSSAYISRALAFGVEAALPFDKRFLQFTAYALGVPAGWPDDIKRVNFDLSLEPRSAEDRVTQLPVGLSFDHWRGSIFLMGTRGSHGVPTWLVCGEVTSLRSASASPER